MSQADATSNAAPLIETKFHAPQRRRGVVHRARLAKRLVGRDQPTLTLVSAPAGFGKTTLLTEWFAADPPERRATAWLSLDARDNDQSLFWAYLIAALQTVVPDVGEDALSLVRSDPSAIEAVAATLLNDLDSVDMDVVVVLDDYHVIESPELHEALAFLLEHLPSHVRLVLSSRSDPPLPLARLRARGELLEIRAADLRFTADEASSYFRESMGLELSEEEVGALEARTEGWVAALQLAALSLRGRDDVAGFIARFAGDDRFVVDYLAEEVLQHQPAAVRAFLLRTAFLGRFTGSLCDAVTGSDDGAAMLETLDRANLFLVPLDDHRHWYRYHHLFGDVLRVRSLAEDPERIREVHRRASEWYEANGDRPAAIEHALSGGHFELAARLIELETPAMRRARQESTLRRWLEALPDGLFVDRPVLSTTLVGARMATGDSTGVEPLLATAERWLAQDADETRGPIVFDEDEYARLPAQVAMYRAALALLAGDIAGTVAHASRIFELAEPSDHFRLGGASALIGLAQWATADLDAARRSYTDSVERFVQAGFIPDVLGCSLALADIQIAQGRLDDATRTFEAGLEYARGRPGLRGTADMHVGLCEVLLDRNELELSSRHLQAAGEHGEHAGLPQNAYRWRVAAARLLHAQGDTEGALELLDEAERFYDTDFSPAVRPIPALRARIQLQQGDTRAANRWAGERGVTVDDELDYVREFEHITLARTLLADPEDLDRAIGLLTRLRNAAEEGGRTGSVIETLVLLARARHGGGDVAAATAALDEALERAAATGHVRVFVDEGPWLAAMLERASRRGAAADHARRITVTAPTSAPRRPRTGLVDELSSRELHVLRLLRSDLSGPDIARELVVSLNTFRTHTKNIYAKLGVTNRREAIRRAGELGL